MSFTFNRQATKSEMLEILETDSVAATIPDTVRAYIVGGVNAFPDNAVVAVDAYGHARAQEGDTNAHSATVKVSQVEE